MRLGLLLTPKVVITFGGHRGGFGLVANNNLDSHSWAFWPPINYEKSGGAGLGARRGHIFMVRRTHEKLVFLSS